MRKIVNRIAERYYNAKSQDYDFSWDVVYRQTEHHGDCMGIHGDCLLCAKEECLKFAQELYNSMDIDMDKVVKIVLPLLVEAYEMGIKREPFSDMQSELDLPSLEFNIAPKLAKAIAKKNPIKIKETK